MDVAKGRLFDAAGGSRGHTTASTDGRGSYVGGSGRVGIPANLFCFISPSLSLEF